MENNNQLPAFPWQSKQGLTKEEYAVIHLSASPPAEFVSLYIEQHPEPVHPGFVADVFKDDVASTKKLYVYYITNFFNIKEGRWRNDLEENDVPREVLVAINNHVKKVQEYYEALELFKLERYIQMEIIWRRKIGVALMESFKQTTGYGNNGR